MLSLIMIGLVLAMAGNISLAELKAEIAPLHARLNDLFSQIADVAQDMALSNQTQELHGKRLDSIDEHRTMIQQKLDRSGIDGVKRISPNGHTDKGVMRMEVFWWIVAAFGGGGALVVACLKVLGKL